jgi:hypothetical protein
MYLEGGKPMVLVNHLILAKYEDHNYGYLRIYVDRQYLKIGFHRVGVRTLDRPSSLLAVTIVSNTSRQWRARSANHAGRLGFGWPAMTLRSPPVSPVRGSPVPADRRHHTRRIGRLSWRPLSSQQKPAGLKSAPSLLLTSPSDFCED